MRRPPPHRPRLPQPRQLPPTNASHRRRPQPMPHTHRRKASKGHLSAWVARMQFERVCPRTTITSVSSTKMIGSMLSVMPALRAIGTAMVDFKTCRSFHSASWSAALFMPGWCYSVLLPDFYHLLTLGFERWPSPAMVGADPAEQAQRPSNSWSIQHPEGIRRARQWPEPRDGFLRRTRVWIW